MTTTIFDRKIEIRDFESFEKLLSIMAADSPSQPLSQHPFSEKERERSAYPTSDIYD